MDADSDAWSDTSDEDGTRDNAPLQSRAYQIEMFEASMQQNIIAVMGTGSGKTQIAKLRIEAELGRSPGKLVWFMAPTVVLVYQQFRFLSRQLPAFQFRLITGHDNAEYWTTPEIWDKVLHNIHVVVSTPAILALALNHGLVSLKGISLLVFDEAHHCVGNTSVHAVMKHHYHPYNVAESGHGLPHILGLSASPITKTKPEEVAKLERNLNAVCKSPLQQIDEYTAFVNMPELLALAYDEASYHTSDLLAALSSVVSSITINHDPYTGALSKSTNLDSKEKLWKILEKQCTPAMEDMRAFLRSSDDLQQHLGKWACDLFIMKGLRIVELTAPHSLDFTATEASSPGKSTFMAAALRPLHGKIHMATADLAESGSVSSKVDMLLQFLQNSHQSDLLCLVFVEKRHTAWSLTEIINNHPVTHERYRAFSFVGVSNPAHKGPFDFAELRVQHDNLESFRRGELNVCVATSVLEEGVDVPAMNLVVCFDKRPNFRSFIQSRGRARRQKSKFVMFPEVALKMKQWQKLEDEMKAESQKAQDDFKEREDVEKIVETGGEVLRIQSTGALLTFSEARQYLDRFCAKMPNRDASEPPHAIFTCVGKPGVELQARVYLPSSLPPNLQTAHSRSSWRTEKKAKQDASFQAYRALYEAGLVTDHLLPPEFPKESKFSKESEEIEGRDSLYAVQEQYSPWPKIMQLWVTPSGTTIYAYRIHIDGPGCFYPDMLILLPVKLAIPPFPLFTSASTRLYITVGAWEVVQGLPVSTARDITVLLLTAILGRRLKGLKAEQLPFLLVPDMDVASLQTWYETASTSTPFTSLDSKSLFTEKEYLVQQTGINVPNLWRPPADQYEPQIRTPSTGVSVFGETIDVVKISRQLNYLLPVDLPTPPCEQMTTLPVADCAVLGIPGVYCHPILLVPSITHMLEVALRSADACTGPLSTLGLSNHNLMYQALTLPSVSTQNYEKLEFLGDLLLKIYASLQVYVDHPNYPAYQLTSARSKLINNARLQRATRDLGLDRYLTRKRFIGSEWTAGIEDLKPSSRKQPAAEISSKTLADIVEAIIGAASLDSVDGGYSEGKLLSALKLFIDEVSWRPMAENVAQTQSLSQDTVLGLDMLAPVESMIGYAFWNHGLLAQALTQSSISGTHASYDRLEFLGDAILDYIVGPKLFHSELCFSPGEMTHRRGALVSHQTLAFFVQQTSCTRTIFHVDTDPQTRKSVDTEKQETVYLPDFIRRIGNRQASKQRQATLSTFLETQPSISAELKSGTKYPWTQLARLGAQKSYSDIFESILAAIFIDSGGNVGSCETFLETIGYAALVRRFVAERDIDPKHPEALLHEVVNQHRRGSKLPLHYVAQVRRIRGTSEEDWRCKVMLGDEVIARVKHARCKDEARYRAAEKAVEMLRNKRKRESSAEGAKDGINDLKDQGNDEHEDEQYEDEDKARDIMGF